MKNVWTWLRDPLVMGFGIGAMWVAFCCFAMMEHVVCLMNLGLWSCFFFIMFKDEIWFRRRKLCLAGLILGLFLCGVIVVVFDFHGIRLLLMPEWRTAAKAINRVMIGTFLIGYSGVIMSCVFNWLFRRRGGRMLGIAIMLIFGLSIYKYVDLRFDEEPACSVGDRIGPIHTVNQMIGITLPSRGVFSKSNTVEAVEAVAANTVVRSMETLQSSGNGKAASAIRTNTGTVSGFNVEEGQVMVYQAYHLLVWMFIATLAFSFSSRDMMNRICSKLMFWNRVCLFWDGVAYARHLVESVRNGMPRADCLLVIDGRKLQKESKAELADAWNVKWIATDVKQESDNLIYVAKRHYFISDDVFSNVERATELADWVLGPGRECFVRVDRIAHLSKWAKTNVKISLLCGNTGTGGGQEKKVVVRPFTRGGIVMSLFYEQLKKDERSGLNVMVIGNGEVYREFDKIRDMGGRLEKSVEEFLSLKLSLPVGTLQKEVQQELAELSGSGEKYHDILKNVTLVNVDEKSFDMSKVTDEQVYFLCAEKPADNFAQIEELKRWERELQKERPGVTFAIYASFRSETIAKMYPDSSLVIVGSDEDVFRYQNIETASGDYLEKLKTEETIALIQKCLRERVLDFKTDKDYLRSPQLYDEWLIEHLK